MKADKKNEKSENDEQRENVVVLSENKGDE